jgi:hypothetical protein
VSTSKPTVSVPAPGGVDELIGALPGGDGHHLVRPAGMWTLALPRQDGLSVTPATARSVAEVPQSEQRVA